MTPATVDRAALGRAGRRRGVGRENRVKERMEERGWTVYRVTHGAADLVAGMRVGEPIGGVWIGPVLVWLIQVKATVGPYDKFGPARREHLRRDAGAMGMVPMLCHWPKNAREPTWIPESDWPS